MMLLIGGMMFQFYVYKKNKAKTWSTIWNKNNYKKVFTM